MWEIEELGGYRNGTHYLVKRRGNDGVLADNSRGGGALHFLVKSEAEAIRDLLNTSELH